MAAPVSKNYDFCALCFYAFALCDFFTLTFMPFLSSYIVYDLCQIVLKKLVVNNTQGRSYV